MSLPDVKISLGTLESSYRRILGRLTADQAIQKIWAKTPSVWQADAEHARVITNRLGWIGVLDKMKAETGRLADFREEISQAGLRDVVLLGMGGSSLAPEVFALTYPAPDNGLRFFVLDTTDPDSICRVVRSIDLAKTLFLVASKSGKTIETLSQFFYFQDRLKNAGIGPAGQNFVAITDPQSYLAGLAKQYRFRQTFLNPADIGGRYSALSYFGLVPAALWGADVEELLGTACEMREACGPMTAVQSNPALQLGALMGAGALEGADKLILLSTPRLAPLSNWIEQLVAESTGKQGKGVVPVAGDVPLTPEIFARGCTVAVLKMKGQDSEVLDAAVKSLETEGVPVAEIRLNGPADLGVEFFRWEAATAVAGAVLGIDPFDEPNVQESKARTGQILEEFQAKGKMPAATARLTESGIELYAEGATRRDLSTLKLVEALRSFFELRKPNDYAALLAYLDRNPDNEARLRVLRETIARGLGVPVLLGFGPRYLHSIGQLYKGGPPTGLFLMVTAAHAEDVTIPGAKYSFEQLQMAQALGDLDSLNRREKPALRLHLTKGAAQGLTELQRAVARALAHVRTQGQ